MPIQIREHPRPNQLTQPPFHAIPVDDSPPVLGDDNSHPRMRQQGSRRPGLEVLGLNPLPCTSDNFEVGFARQPQPTGETQGAMRRRISSVVGP